MKRLKKIFVLGLAINFILSILLTYVPIIPIVSISRVYAASFPINVYVEEYSDGNLDIRWDALTGAKSAKISYHSPESSNPDKLETIILNEPVNKVEIKGLLNDVIYDIDVSIFNNSGAEIGRGLLHFLPSMTFQAKVLNQTYNDIQGGGREIGIDPSINLKWMVPKTWDGEKFDYTHNALSYMQSRINAVYDDGREINKLNYRVNISTDSSKLNGGSIQAAVIIDYNEGEYSAYVSGNEGLKSKVRSIDSNGFLSFDLIGKTDEEAVLPTPLEYQLPHAGILPGTVYYMNIKMAFQDKNGAPIGVVSVGPPDAMNGSTLLGPVSYIFTPIRFQITKDDVDNIYIKIFRINQGSLDLPRLYYEIQSSDDPTISGDWPVKRKIDDTYFSGGFAVTVISGVHPDNEIYYKIVVKSDNVSDRLQSSKMPYVLIKDTSRPPVPTNINVTERLLSPGIAVNPVTKKETSIKSTDVTISWDKPADWDLIKDDLCFHIMLSTNQTDLDKDVGLYADDVFWGSYPVKFRLIKYVNAKSPNIKEVGNRLFYTIKGFELFCGEDEDGIPDKVIDNNDGYPECLLPNRVYYIQMYSTKAVDAGLIEPEKISDKSLVKSFTTLSGLEREVPSPANVKANRNEINKDTKQNVIELQFDKVNIDWNLYMDKLEQSKEVYYDLYMSTRTEADSFVRIGSTQYLDRDILFTGVSDPDSSYIRAIISTFTKGTNKYNPDDGLNGDSGNDGSDPGNNGGDNTNYIDPYEVFGASLRPNTVYYFVLKTRLVIDEKPPHKESSPTPVLPVTTPRDDIDDPDETSRRPLAPSDFSIAVDKDGNLEISGSKVAFRWSLLESDASYKLICTSERVAPDAKPSDYENDSIYQSFIAHFGNKDSDGDKNNFTLDPKKDLKKDVFEYDSVLKAFKLTISEWIFPNRLYYFSIKAQMDGKESVWISIPVTTSLIEMPDLLEPIHDCEIGFFWHEYNSNVRPEDYRVYLKGPKDNDYREISRSKLTMVKDGNVFYCRIKDLESDSFYSVRVYRGKDNSTLVYHMEDIPTRQACYEIEVKWRGVEGYRYEIAVRTEDDEEYIIVNDDGLEHFTDRYGRTFPYYIEKTSRTVGSEKSFYYAKIKSLPRISPDGQVTQWRLDHNTKYYIKVRAYRVDPIDSTLYAYSKYIGPVFLRTEFSQEDYDKDEEEERKKVIFTDRIKKFEEALYWEVNTRDSSEYVILLKGERIANYIENSNDSYFTLDFPDIPYGVETNIIYVPTNIINALKTEGKGFNVNISGVGYCLRPETLNILEIEQVKNLKDKKGVRDTFVQLTIYQSADWSIDSSIGRSVIDQNNSIPAGLPSNVELVSPIIDFGIKVFGTTKMYGEIKDNIENKLYNAETGLVQEKTKFIEDYYLRVISDDKVKVNEYMDGLIKQMEKELSMFIQNTLQLTKVKNAEEDINIFGSPLNIKLPFNSTYRINTTNNGNINSTSQGLYIPYVKYVGNDRWSKVSQNVSSYEAFMTFNVLAPGKYVIFKEIRKYMDIPKDYPDRDYILDFISNYDVGDIFQLSNVSSGNFSPERRLSVKEAILLYELATGKTREGMSLSIKEKAKKMGLENVVNAGAPAKDISRQEAAGLIMKIYVAKLGLDYDKLKPGSNLLIKDEEDIDDRFYKAVVILIDNKIMKLDARRCFEPLKYITRGEMLAALGKVLN